MRVIVVEAVGRTTAEMRPRPRAGDGNLASDQRSGATSAGWRQQKQEVPTAIGGVGREKWGAVVGTSGGDDSSSKDDVSKGGGAVVEPRSKIPQQPTRQSSQSGQPGQPGSQASGEIWASRAKRHAAPAGSGGRKETTPGRKENAPATKK